VDGTPHEVWAIGNQKLVEETETHGTVESIRRRDGHTDGLGNRDEQLSRADISHRVWDPNGGWTAGGRDPEPPFTDCVREGTDDEHPEPPEPYPLPDVDDQDHEDATHGHPSRALLDFDEVKDDPQTSDEPAYDEVHRRNRRESAGSPETAVNDRQRPRYRGQ
jgi:hypothetical protein